MPASPARDFNPGRARLQSQVTKPWSILMGSNRRRGFGPILSHPLSLLGSVRYRSAASLLNTAERLFRLQACGDEQRRDDERGPADTRAAVDRHVLPRLHCLV